MKTYVDLQNCSPDLRKFPIRIHFQFIISPASLIDSSRLSLAAKRRERNAQARSPPARTAQSGGDLLALLRSAWAAGRWQPT